MLANIRSLMVVAAIASVAVFPTAAFAGKSSSTTRNTAPTISGSPPTSVLVNTAYGFVPSAYDADGNRLSFSIANKPRWASFSKSTGRLSGTPIKVGTYNSIQIKVSDGRTTASLPVFSITVSTAAPVSVAPNSPPTISGTAPTGVTAGENYLFRPSGSDANGDPLTYSIVGKPAWANFETSTGALYGTPMASDAGSYAGVTISVSDGKATASLAPFTITVTAPVVNHSPTISGSPVTSAVADRPYVFRPTATDADNDALQFSIAGKPSWASFEPATGTLYGTPIAIDAGTYSGITISVSDGKSTASLAPFAITVSAPVVNHSPTISGSPVTSAMADRPYVFKATAVDPDNDPLQFSIAGKPSWATFEPATGTLYGTPTASNVGTYPNIVISVSDGKLSAALPAFTITVAAAPTKSVTLNWTAPTQNTDGSALGDLAGYIVSYGNASRQYTTTFKLPDAAANSVVLEGFQAGTWYFSIKSFNVSGVESDYSGEVSAVL